LRDDDEMRFAHTSRPILQDVSACRRRTIVLYTRTDRTPEQIEMLIYTIAAHDALTGEVRRVFTHTKRSAVWQAEVMFNRGAYLWVDAIRKDKRGRLAHVHHIERAPTDAERAAIAARYVGA
jgi:hypothetical protein